MNVRRVLPWLLALLSLGVALVDIFVRGFSIPALDAYFSQDHYLPAVVYVVPILVAAYFLRSPLVVAAIAAWTVALQVVAYALEGYGPTILPVSYVLGLSLMSTLVVILSDRVRREVGLREQLEVTLEKVQAQSEELLAQSEEIQTQAEMRLAEAEGELSLLRRLLENAASVGVCLLDGRELRVKWANPAYLEFLEEPYRSEGIVGRRLHDFAPRTEESGLAEVFRQVARTGQPHIDPEYEYDGFARGATYWHWSLVPLPAPGENTPDLMILAVEVTEQVRARREVEAERARLNEVLAQLQIEQERWQTTVESMPDFVAMCDEQGRVTYINPAYQRHIGYLVDPALPLEEHSRYYQLYHPDGTMFSPEELPLQRAALHNEEVHQVEVVERTANGSEFAGIFNAAPLHDGEGRVVGAVVIGRDVTAQREAELERERLLTTLEAIFACITDPLVVYDASGAVVRCNPAATESYGIDPNTDTRETLARKLSIRRADGRPVSPEELPSSRVLRGEKVVREPLRFVDAHGKETAILNSASPLIVGGKPEGVVSIAFDVTETQALLAELQRQRAELAAIVEGTQAQLALLDRDMNFILVNSAYAAGSGYTREQLVGRNHFALFPHAENQTIFEHVRDTGEPYQVLEKPFEFPDRPELGTTYWNWVLVPIKGEDGSTRELLISLLDVTEQVRARHEVEQALKARDVFLSVAAHELKTPVTSLQGFSQLLIRQFARTGALDPARIVQAMERIDAQSRRLTKLTEQLLNLSRLEAGKLPLSRQETDLADLVANLVGTIRHSHPDRTIDLRGGPTIAAYVDALRLEQVVTNLVDNALKFSPPDRPVEVEVGEDAWGWARIAVRDHGIGVPEAERERIFERFHQAHPERHAGGMGIGLFLSQQIVELHGGTIALEQPEDGGSSFVVRLPLSPHDDDAPPA